MMLFGFSILYVFALFKSYSEPIAFEPIIKEGEIVAISCSTDVWEVPVSFFFGQVDGEIFSNWREDYIYPVKICATVRGGKVGLCDPIIESKLELSMLWSKGDLSVPINPDDFIDSNTYCHVFKASAIASVLTNFTDVELYPRAYLYGIPETGKTATVQVSIRVAPYYFNETGSIVPAGGTNMLHAVVCDFPDCTVTIEGPHKIKATEYFRKEKGKFPKYEGTSGPVTDKTFSVTSVECDGSGCPTRFIANDAAIEAPQPLQGVPETPQYTLETSQDSLPTLQDSLPTLPEPLPMPPKAPEAPEAPSKVQEPLPTLQEGLETLLKAPATKTDATHMAAGAAQTMIKSSDAMPEGLHDFDRKIGTVIVNSEILVWRSGKTNGLQIFD